MSNDPIGVTEEATFALTSEAPEGEDGEVNLGYCTCLPGEPGRTLDCGIPEHRAAGRAFADAAETGVAETTQRILSNADGERAVRERLAKIAKLGQDIAIGADVAKALPDGVTVDMLIARALSIIPPDVHAGTADPFTAGFRQACLVFADQLGLHVPFRHGFTILFEPDTPAATIDRVRDELGRRAQQLLEAL